MPSQIVNLKIAGLQTNDQYLGEVPEGALLKCVNFNHDRPGILEKRRGFYIYGDSLGISTDRAKQLISYKQRIIRHYSSQLDVDNGSGTFTTYSGTINPPSSTMRIKSQEINGNLYFTSSEGVKKIDAKNASNLITSTIKNAGGVKSLHIEATISGTVGFLNNGYKVGYRSTWAYTDNNNNLIIGTPSELLTIENNSGNPTNIQLTFPIPSDVTTLHFYQIYRTQQVPIANVIEDELNLVIEEFPTTSQFSSKIVVTTDITPDDFREGGAALYTNAISGTGIISANEPPPLCNDITLFKNFAFYANTKTRHQLSINLLSVDDIYDALTNLVVYSNGTVRTYTFNTTENTLTGQIKRTTSGTVAFNVQETAKSIVRVINSDPSSLINAFYESSIDDVPGQILFERKNLEDNAFSVAMNYGDNKELNPSLSQINSINTIQVGNPTTITTKTLSFNSTSDVSVGSDTITLTSHGMYSGQEIKTSGTLPGGLSSGIYYVFKVDNNTIKLCTSEDEARKDTPVVVDITSTSVGTGSINSTHKLATGNQIYIYNSNSTPSVNGERTVTIVDEISFTIPVNVTIAGNAGLFFNLTDAQSNNDEKSNRIYYSKLQQPEAVPALNYIDIGPQDKEIRRILGLRDSLFVFKDDGIYRLSGETPNSFTVQQFDSSAIITAPDSATILNNQIYVLTTQGVVIVSDTGVQIVSQSIDVTLTEATSSSNYKQYTFALASESDKAYYLWTTSKSTDTVATQCFRYSTDTNSWTVWDKKQSCGTINPGDDIIYLGASDTNYIEKERKSLNRTDHADREYQLLLNSNGIEGNIVTGIVNVTNVNDGDVLAQTQYLTIAQVNQLLRQLDLDQLTFKSIVSISATNPTVIQVTGHQLSTGDVVTIQNVNGTNNNLINLDHVVTVIDANNFSIDLDSTVNSFYGGKAKYGFSGSLFTSPGDNLTLKLEQLSTKLQLFFNDSFSDTNSKIGFYGASNQYCYNFNAAPLLFLEQQQVYNLITTRLNESTQFAITNYPQSNGTLLFEELVLNVDNFTKDVTVFTIPNFIAGPMVVYKAFISTVQWAPSHAGDPSVQKRILDGAIIVDNQGFSSLEVKYATDLSPGFEGNEFLAEGIGMYGQTGFGQEGFGGVSSSRPIRCLIPRNKSRCRFISPRVRHLNARETVRIFGFNLTIEPTTQRNYRGSGILNRG